jgi:hypothetical protein
MTFFPACANLLFLTLPGGEAKDPAAVRLQELMATCVKQPVIEYLRRCVILL